MKGVILSGGLGTRLRPPTHTGAKQLIPIANKPVLEYCIEQLIDCGITEIGIVVGYTLERIQSIKDVIGDGSRWDIRITYIEQDAPRGIAHGVYCSKEFVGTDNFVVFLGDNIIKDPIYPIIRKFESDRLDAGMLLAEESDPRPYGVAVLDGEKVTGVVEKPEFPPSNLAVIGVYYFSPVVFFAIGKQKPSTRGELEITDTLNLLLKNPDCTTGSARIKGWWDDTGTGNAVLRANRLMLSDNGVTVGEGTVITPGSVLSPHTIIGKNCIIHRSFIGEFTSIGDNCRLYGVHIKSSILVGGITLSFEPFLQESWIVNSLIGKYTRIRAGENHEYTLVLGENSEVSL